MTYLGRKAWRWKVGRLVLFSTLTVFFITNIWISVCYCGACETNDTSACLIPDIFRWWRGREPLQRSGRNMNVCRGREMRGDSSREQTLRWTFQTRMTAGDNDGFYFPKCSFISLNLPVLLCSNWCNLKDSVCQFFWFFWNLKPDNISQIFAWLLRNRYLRTAFLLYFFCLFVEVFCMLHIQFAHCSLSSKFVTSG